MNQPCVIEGWPALMSTETAARYMSIDETTLLDVVTRFSVRPVELELGTRRWNRKDLDRLIGRLPSAPQAEPSGGAGHGVVLDSRQIELLADAIARRTDRGQRDLERKLVSIRESGTILGIGRSTIYRMIEDGRLGVRRIGRRTLVQMDDLNAILAGHEPTDVGA